MKLIYLYKQTEFVKYFEIQNANDLSRKVDNYSKMRAFCCSFWRIRLIDNIALN